MSIGYREFVSSVGVLLPFSWLSFVKKKKKKAKMEKSTHFL